MLTQIRTSKTETIIIPRHKLKLKLGTYNNNIRRKKRKPLTKRIQHDLKTMKAGNLLKILAAAAATISEATPLAIIAHDISTSTQIEHSKPPPTKKLLHGVGSFQVTDFVAAAVVLSHRVL